MKFFLFLFLYLPLITFAQDTTNVTLTDSVKMYTYKNVYAVINPVIVTAPGTDRSSPLRLVKQTADSAKWVTNVSFKVFASKADAIAGRGELFIRYLPTLYTDKFPTYKEIMDRMRSGIK